MRRRDLIAAAAGAIAASVLVGGVAWSAIPNGGVIQGCYDSGGNVKVVAALPCPKGYTPLAWNQQGPKGIDGIDGKDGVDGVSVSSATLGAGNANCAEGGAQFNAANGVTFACNGAPGEDGTDGQNGVGVTGVPEPAGANCANGGTKLNAANGVTYACNGKDGLNGSPGVGGAEYVFAQGVATAGGAFGRFPLEARCSAGKKALGGGFGGSDTVRALSPELSVLASEPSIDGGGWYVFVTNPAVLQFDRAFVVWAVCASA